MSLLNSHFENSNKHDATTNVSTIFDVEKIVRLKERDLVYGYIKQINKKIILIPQLISITCLWYYYHFTTYSIKYIDSFDCMNLTDNVLRGIYAYGFERPSSIQQRAIVPIIQS